MINAKITELKGVCNCGHEVGDTFELSCHSADGLCGFFYHEIFPKLSVMQYGGKYPWWEEGQSVFEAECPDRKNAVTLRLEVKPRD
jgi:uncharacterized repeat protein (TIGR04076 family)